MERKSYLLKIFERFDINNEHFNKQTILKLILPDENNNRL